MGETLWEKALIVGACLIAAAFMAIVAKREFLDSPSDAPPQVAQSLPGEVPPDTDQAVSEVAGASRTTSGRDEEDLPAEEPRRRAARQTRPDEFDCAFLKPRHDRSREERLWYIDNCIFLSRKNRAQDVAPGVQTRDGIEAQLQAAGFTLDAGAPRRSATDAGATPTSELTADVAVAMTVDWIPDNTPVNVSLTTGDCIPIWLNGHWVVTCTVTLEGCAGTNCVASLSVCVFPTEPAIVPDRFC